MLEINKVNQLKRLLAAFSLLVFCLLQQQSTAKPGALCGPTGEDFTYFECERVYSFGLPNVPDALTGNLSVLRIPWKKGASSKTGFLVVPGGPGQDFVGPFSAALNLKGVIDLKALTSQGSLDLITFNIFGSENSERPFSCTTSDTVLQTTRDATLSFGNLLLGCGQIMKLRNYNFQNFSTLRHAQDIEIIRQHYGYEKLIVYGGSFGSNIASLYATLYPKRVKYLILDGLVLPSAKPLEQSWDAYASAFRRFAKDCKCDAEYPNLKAQVEQLLTARDAELVRGRETWKTLILNYVFENMLFSAETAQNIPNLLAINAASKEPLVPEIANYLNGLSLGKTGLREGFRAIGMVQLSAWCNDNAWGDWTSSAAVLAYQKTMMADDFVLGRYCAGFRATHSPVLSPPIVTSVPTLIITGRFDPRLKLPSNALLKKSFKSYKVVTMQSGFHTSLFAGDSKCAVETIASFISGRYAGSPPCTKVTKVKFRVYRDGGSL